MDSGDDKGDAKNEGGQVGTTGQEMGESHPPLHRSMQQRRPPSPCHLCHQEIREECRKEDSLPHMARVSTFVLDVQNEYYIWKREREIEKEKKKHGRPNTSI